MIPDSDLMELVQLYKARWLSCVTQEEAQRLRDEIARLTPSPAEQAQMDLNQKARERRAKVGDGTPTPAVPSLGEGIMAMAKELNDQIAEQFDLGRPLNERDHLSLLTTLHADRLHADDLATVEDAVEYIDALHLKLYAFLEAIAAGKQSPSDTDLCEATPKPTHGVMPASEDIMAGLAAVYGEINKYASLDGKGAVSEKWFALLSHIANAKGAIIDMDAEITRLRKFEEYDKRLQDSARRERERGDDAMGPST